MSKKEFKGIVKEKVRKKSVEDMNKIKENHSKVKEVTHSYRTQPEEYLISIVKQTYQQTKLPSNES